MFRRRRRAEDADPEGDDLRDSTTAGDDLDDLDDADAADDDAADDDAADGAAPDDAADELTDRPDGPWDVDEVDLSPDTPRLDLGALLLPAVEGVELQVQVDEASGTVIFVTAVLGDGAVQLQAFAAPRTSGIWVDVRSDLRASITSGGGLVEEIDGPFGTQLKARVPGQAPDGTRVLQPARFVGIDGPRWFLRAVFLGTAASGGAGAAPLEDLVRGVVVVRGSQAMAPGSPLPLVLPAGAQGPEPAPGPAGRPPLNPFERGPEITEVR